MSRGYYMNSLKAERTKLQKELCSAMARYARMEKMHHPDKLDQGLLIDYFKRCIRMVEADMDNVNTDALIAQS